MGCRKVAFIVATAFATVALVGCDKKTLDSWFPKQEQATSPTESLFEAAPLRAGMEALESRFDEPIQALSLLIYRDRLILHARDPDEPTRVDEYVYARGKVEGPVGVELLGDGRLEHNLFSLDAADISQVPSLVKAAREKMRTPDSEVSRVLLKRNLPESMDIQFRVFINSPRRDTHIDADKDGEIVE